MFERVNITWAFEPTRRKTEKFVQRKDITDDMVTVQRYLPQLSPTGIHIGACRHRSKSHVSFNFAAPYYARQTQQSSSSTAGSTTAARS